MNGEPVRQELVPAVHRFAQRGWDSAVVDPEDVREKSLTRYVFRGGAAPIAQALVRKCFMSPAQFWGALTLAIRMSRHAEKSLLFHLIYLAEACRLAESRCSLGATILSRLGIHRWDSQRYRALRPSLGRMLPNAATRGRQRHG